MSFSFATMAQQAPVPVWGYDKQDVGMQNGTMSLVDPTLVGNVSASGGVQDLATAGIQIDTSIPLRGFLVGIAILVAIRVLWEAMEE